MDTASDGEEPLAQIWMQVDEITEIERVIFYTHTHTRTHTLAYNTHQRTVSAGLNVGQPLYKHLQLKGRFRDDVL